MKVDERTKFDVMNAQYYMLNLSLKYSFSIEFITHASSIKFYLKKYKLKLSFVYSLLDVTFKIRQSSHSYKKNERKRKRTSHLRYRY
jgi:hypothetical protein